MRGATTPSLLGLGLHSILLRANLTETINAATSGPNPRIPPEHERRPSREGARRTVHRIRQQQLKSSLHYLYSSTTPPAIVYLTQS